MDFTLKIYKTLIEALKEQNYQFLTIVEYFTRQVASSSRLPIIIMRHDVDRKPQNALTMAKLEAELGVKATYYFRTIPHIFKPEIIKEIAKLGHEIGYHYESLSSTNGNMKLAIKDFEYNLNRLRMYYPIRNIAMHGKALSKWDNRDLWKKYNYKDYRIISEPYFDIDFKRVLYLTDTGQRWDGNKYSLRDKPICKNFAKANFKTTQDILLLVEANSFSPEVMINIHPERWNDNFFLWIYYYFEQLLKRNVKLLINKLR